MCAVICVVLAVALLLPTLAQCSGEVGLTVEKKGAGTPADRPAEAVQGGNDGCFWLWPVVRQIIIWIGGICFYKCVTYKWAKSNEPPPAMWQGPPEPPRGMTGSAGAWRR